MRDCAVDGGAGRHHHQHAARLLEHRHQRGRRISAVHLVAGARPLDERARLSGIEVVAGHWKSVTFGIQREIAAHHSEPDDAKLVIHGRFPGRSDGGCARARAGQLSRIYEWSNQSVKREMSDSPGENCIPMLSRVPIGRSGHGQLIRRDTSVGGMVFPRTGKRRAPRPPGTRSPRRGGRQGSPSLFATLPLGTRIAGRIEVAEVQPRTAFGRDAGSQRHLDAWALDAGGHVERAAALHVRRCASTPPW